MPSGLRIASGTSKNKRLSIPKMEGFRAVQEVVKLAIFSIIGEGVVNSRCLDLYAGSGNLGLEALSRGAAWCDFVDEHREAKQTITDNIKKCGFEDNSAVHLNDAVKYVANTDQKYDIIFIDPFYENTAHRFLMKSVGEILNRDGLIFFLHGKNANVEHLIDGADLEIITKRRFGKSYFAVIKPKR
jgi:16S rRNA (guanine966-N2)-methyltransferase